MAQVTPQITKETDSNHSLSKNSTDNEEVTISIIKTLSRSDACFPTQAQAAFNSDVEKKISRKETQTATTPEKKVYSYSKKAGFLGLMGIAGIMGPLASSMHVPALKAIMSEFQTDYSTASITVTVFLVAIGIGPLIWAMLSDAYGRKWFTVASMVIFALGSVGCALSTGIEMLIVMRLIQGLGSAAPMVIGIGVISDVFPRSEMGRAIGLFTIGPLLGPVIGPIIGGYMSQYVGWRALFYLITGLAVLMGVLVAVFMEETLDPSKRLPKPIARSKDTGKLEFSKELPNPFSCLLFLKHIDVVLLCTWASFIFGSYYAISISQPITVGIQNNLTTSQVGLTFIAIGVGNILGSTGSGYLSDYIVNNYSKKNNGQTPPPELRLKITLMGAVVIIAALLMNGWFISNEFHIAAVLFAQFLVGASMVSMFSGISNYYVETFPGRSASVSACNACVRVIFAAITSAITPLLLDSIGVGNTFTFYAGLQILGLIILICMIFFGPRIRAITRS
ncbi:MFS general substrate transporter [Conidiobolus coronatus NRRL 28638]|uniref:MFS general substrate transporter n=1 Tax=Conidiobolus coronatus (strain ATCC 28846 / CBS 209.66 / NRRL 28638) TaxID=796925 RepID=A0A137P802_CONC2|nr:MFS general substrate transporter [Conidiobolus coronatus NRRL 28638]|eukprot:KXN71074.1 MFS general substrate transporter [Conidiobolus coronatus NRRL 28638]